MSIFRELKRRNVFRAAVAYAVVGWLLAEVGALAFETFEAPAWVMKTFGTVIVLGFPLALFLAWAYELTPEGLKRERDVDRSQSITHITGRKLDYFVIGVLAVVLAYFAFDKFVLSPGRDAALSQTAADSREVANADKSIAVLPFVNMSDDKDNEYFSDGISEEILNALARVQDLKVAGRTSSFAFKDKNDDLRTIGKALGVSYILEGSVRKADVRVRITAQLIKVEDGFHLWSEIYERELTDIFAIQDEIAQSILVQLKARLGTGNDDHQFASVRTDVDAFDLYLAAKHNIYMRNTDSLEQAAELLDRAIEIDAGYASAYAQRGITLMLLADNQYGTIPSQEAASRAKDMFDKALSLDPASAEALAGLGLYLTQQGEHEQAIETLGKARSINPNLVNAGNWLANAHARLGHLEDVKRIRQEILVRDPLFLPGISNLLDDYMLYGEIEQAQALMDRINPYMSASRIMLSWNGVMHFVAGRVAESMPYFEAAFEMEPNHPGTKNQLTRALYYSGQYERLLEIGLDEFRMYGLMHLGRLDEALLLATELADNGQALAPLQVLAARRQYAELIEYVESRWSSLEAFEEDHSERDGWSEHNYLGLIAYAYQHVGNVKMYNDAMRRYEAALNYQRQMGADNQTFRFAEAVHGVLNGDLETSLMNLTAAIRGGVTYDPNLSNSWPMFEVLEGDPRYDAIVNRMIDQLNAERAKLGLSRI